MLILSAINGGPDSERVRATVAGFRAESQALIAARIARGREAGELPTQVAPETLAAFYMTVIEGMSLQARDGADQARLEAIAAAAMAAWPGRRNAAAVRAPARRSAGPQKRP
jgi:hypothetical protein